MKELVQAQAADKDACPTCLDGQAAIITGAANGIGRGIALKFAEAGADLVIADIDLAAGQETVRAVEGRGRKARLIETDVRQDADLDRLVDETLKEFDRIDILVNNAGINAPGGFLGVSRSDLRSVFDTDMVGPYILTQRVAREMIQRSTHGRILCISSIHSVVACYRPYYSMAKIALERMVVDAALELAPYQIRVNGIRPGGIKIRGELCYGTPENVVPHIPLEQRNGYPFEVADLALFLVSEGSRYITGTTVTIDGALSQLSFSALGGRENVWREQRELGIPAPAR